MGQVPGEMGGTVFRSSGGTVHKKLKYYLLKLLGKKMQVRVRGDRSCGDEKLNDFMPYTLNGLCKARDKLHSWKRDSGFADVLGIRMMRGAVGPDVALHAPCVVVQQMVDARKDL